MTLDNLRTKTKSGDQEVVRTHSLTLASALQQGTMKGKQVSLLGYFTL